jgi:tRNA nucleotidyltransferase (CCA-adding enzyme)
MLSPEQQPHSIGVLVDPQCGLADIDAKKIRCVGVANDRLQEDALRIIRAVRFAVTLEEFDFIKETWQALEDNYALVESVPAERIGQEIMKTLYSDNFF